MLGSRLLGSRRRWLTISASAVGVFAATPLFLLAQRSPQPIPSPHAPNPNFPPGLDGPDLKPGTDNKSADPQIQREIRGDVLKLYELASELKEQVEKTDAGSTLSLSVVKTAQQIEKLAKQIKNLSRG
jgi:hypothetical protein